ncbi:LysR family transcriptional regulator [Actinobacillus capsulatus]|uniref:LysR family transcriptional regulator n=1 Tax=Actinobacillus capsulatus TaxID=717 RepID=UPI00036B37F8|nr:LysR family transcriptional regulator [Actinobacillus capsulatus]
MKENLNDLRTFLLVAQTGSFTKAGAMLGVSQSAVSHAMRALEERLKIKLFHRTTRSISTTDAGEQLYQRIAPLLDEINHEINELSEFRHSLKGTLRIHGTELAFGILWGKFDRLLRENPEIQLELASDIRFTDIVAERFDAGIRLGDDVAKDMIAIKVSDELEMVCVASPTYLAEHGTPQTLDELAHHNCLALRLPTNGGLLEWEFRTFKYKNKTIKIQPSGSVIANSNSVLINACCSSLGIAWQPKMLVEQQLVSGQLCEIFCEYAMRYSPFHLYYPNRRENSALFRVLVEALRV